MNRAVETTLSKVPEVTLFFWIIKIAATTLGETGGDTVTMTLNWGYLTGTAIFAALLIALVVCQILSKRFHPLIYWATIIASTTFGTTMADFADRSLGIGYTGGSTILLICVIASLLIWRWSTGSISIETVSTPNPANTTKNPPAIAAVAVSARPTAASRLTSCPRTTSARYAGSMANPQGFSAATNPAG